MCVCVFFLCVFVCFFFVCFFFFYFAHHLSLPYADRAYAAKVQRFNTVYQRKSKDADVKCKNINSWTQGRMQDDF